MSGQDGEPNLIKRCAALAALNIASRRLRRQAERISRCRLTFHLNAGGKASGLVNQSIVDRALFIEPPLRTAPSDDAGRDEEAVLQPNKETGGDRKRVDGNKNP